MPVYVALGRAVLTSIPGPSGLRRGRMGGASAHDVMTRTMMMMMMMMTLYRGLNVQAGDG